MCPKCKKTHAADVACEASAQRSAAQILSDLESGIRGCVDAVKTMDARMKDVESRIKTRSIGAANSLPGVEDEKQKFSFHRLIVSLAAKNPALAPFERDVCLQTNKLSGRELNSDGTTVRDLDTGTDSAGGYLVPHQVSGELIPLLRANLVTGALGVSRMDGLTGGSFAINKQTGSATAYDVGEVEAITKSQQTFGQVEVRPRELAALTVLSNRLLRLSNPAAEGVIRDDLMKVVALAEDLRIMRGTGNKQPVGIANTPGISTRSIAAALTVDNLYNMIYDVEKNNAAGGRLGWAFHPRTWNGLRQLKDAEGRYILTPGGTGQGPQQNPAQSGMLLGYPFVTTTQIPITLGAGSNASQVIFGNWADVLLATWLNMEIAASSETSDAFQKNQTWIRLITEYDIVVKHGQSFCVDGTIL